MEIVPADRAPEFREIKRWVNSPPLSIKNLKGSVTLLDCWTYTCIFCLRTLPVMKRLHEKYSKYGLRVVEAHSREYDFAAEEPNVLRALSKYNVTDVPVALDLANKTWDAYGNTYWPRHTLIDRNGLVRYEHAGYGGISDFEEAVVELLREGSEIPVDMPLDTQDPQDEIYDTYGVQFAGVAPEICVGYSRLRRFGNNQKVKPDTTNVFVDAPSHDINVVYLRGKWLWQRECVTFAPGGKEIDPAVMMYYNSAKRVHGILGTNDGKPGEVEIRLDGNPLTRDQLGKECKLEDGKSVVEVGWPFIYNLARMDKPEVHEIQIIPRSSNISFYTFVFG